MALVSYEGGRLNSPRSSPILGISGSPAHMRREPIGAQGGAVDLSKFESGLEFVATGNEVWHTPPADMSVIMGGALPELVVGFNGFDPESKHK